MEWTPALLGVAFLVALGFLLKRLVRAIGMPCQFCDNNKLTYFDKLPLNTRVAILSYFREREKRTPDTDGLFICLNCHTVHDDFSGEKRSWDTDYAAGVGPSGIPELKASARTFCKVCNRLIYGCDPGRDDIHCEFCGTHYQWQVHEPSDFRFFMPPEDAQVLERCKDSYGIA
jgi:hypothetical protein